MFTFLFIFWPLACQPFDLYHILFILSLCVERFLFNRWCLAHEHDKQQKYGTRWVWKPFSPILFYFIILGGIVVILSTKCDWLQEGHTPFLYRGQWTVTYPAYANHFYPTYSFIINLYMRDSDFDKQYVLIWYTMWSLFMYFNTTLPVLYGRQYLNQ